jgi:cell fate (sporulation/competence/biofilm development) regulator YmcA (YheA/YmcA/DUF963 family)
MAMYGSHTPITLALSKNNVDLSHWKNSWKPNEYNFLVHNCAHAALSCLIALGVVEKLDATTRNRLEQDFNLRRILRPAELAGAMLEAVSAEIRMQRSKLITTNRLNVLETSTEEINGLVVSATDLVNHLASKEEKGEAPAILQTLAQQLKTCRSIVDIKMQFAQAIDKLSELAHPKESSSALEIFLGRIQAIEPDIKTRLAAYIDDEIHLFSKITHKETRQKQAPLYMDLMILQYRMPSLSIDDVNKEISEILLKYHAIQQSMALNFIHCQFAINALKPDQKVFYEQDYQALKSQFDIKKRYQDLYEKVVFKAKKVGAINFMHDALKQLLQKSIAQPNEDIDKNINEFKLIEKTLSHLQGYLKTYSFTNTFQYAAKHEEDVLTDPLVAFSDAQLDIKALSVIFEDLLQKRLTSTSNKVELEPEKVLWNHDHLDWLKYKLANMLFWSNASRETANTERLVDFMHQLRMSEKTHESNTTHYIFNEQTNLMVRYWHEKKADKKDLLAQEIGLVLKQIDKINRIDDLTLPETITPYEHKITEAALLLDDNHANDRFAELRLLIRELPADSLIAMHLNEFASRLTRFHAVGILTPQQAMEEFMTEIDHALQTKQADKTPVLDQLQMLKDFFIKTSDITPSASVLNAVNLQKDSVGADINHHGADSSSRRLNQSEVISIIKSGLLDSDIAPKHLGKLLALLNLFNDDNTVLLKVKTEILQLDMPNVETFRQSSVLESGASAHGLFHHKSNITHDLYHGIVSLITEVENDQPIMPPLPNQKPLDYLCHFKRLDDHELPLTNKH